MKQYILMIADEDGQDALEIKMKSQQEISRYLRQSNIPEHRVYVIDGKNKYLKSITWLKGLKEKHI